MTENEYNVLIGNLNKASELKKEIDALETYSECIRKGQGFNINGYCIDSIWDLKFSARMNNFVVQMKMNKKEEYQNIMKNFMPSKITEYKEIKRKIDSYNLILKSLNDNIEKGEYFKCHIGSVNLSSEEEALELKNIIELSIRECEFAISQI